jgi:capsular exopolysaccharide synthesis family protein
MLGNPQQDGREADRIAPAEPSGRPGAGYGSAPYEASLGSDGEVHLLDYVRVLYKRRWIALTVFAVVVAVVSVYTYSAVATYTSRAEILIEKEDPNVVTFKDPFEQNRMSDDYYQTQYKILRSRALARRTIEMLKLSEDPRLNPVPNQGLSLGRVIRAPMRMVSGWFSGRETAADMAASADETRMQARLIDRVLGGLAIVPVPRSRLVDITFTSADPTLPAVIANGIARAYIEQNLEYKFLSSKEATDWLAARLAEQREEVDASEQALQRYREENGAIALDGSQNIVVQKLADLNAAVTRAKTDRIEREAVYRQIQAIEHDRAALDTFPAILSNAFIQQLKTDLSSRQRELAEQSEKLGDKHPTIIALRSSIELAERKLQAEVNKVVQSVRNEFLAAQAEENSLTEALNQQKGEALSMNRRGIEYAVLSREAASNRQIFDVLMQRTKETGISGELKTSNIRIVDAAEPPRGPSSPNRRRNMLVGIFAGFTLALAVAFFFEYIDNRMKSPEEVKQHLGLPFLGMIPALFEKGLQNPLMTGGVPTNFAEAFRAMRTNLVFSSAEEGSRSIVITSTGPGEGKTAVATNTAVALAQAGQRVLLIDADMRKPRVHEVFEKAQEPGLSNLLVGNAKSSESLHKTHVPGLWVMPAGQHPPNPAELLASKRFRDFVASLGQHFDWVIIDTPPVMAVTDASVVAHVTTGVIFVVGAEMTSRYAAQRAVEQLRHSRANIVGAVLNRVDLQHNAYYYSHYYRHEYATYYQKDAKT